MKTIDQFVYLGDKKLKFKSEYDFMLFVDVLRRLHKEYKDLTAYHECYPEGSARLTTDMIYAQFTITGMTIADAREILNSPAYRIVTIDKDGTKRVK